MFKKLFAILFLILMLCSCNVEKTPEPALPEESSSSEAEVEEEPKKETEISEPYLNSPSVSVESVPEKADYIGNLGEEEIFAAEFSREERPFRFFDEDGRQYLENAEIIAYELFDREGNKILSHPVEDYHFSEPGERGNDGQYLLECSYKGDRYVYDQESGYSLVSHEKAGPKGEYLNGFEITEYFWGVENGEKGIGLLNPDGSVFVEPVFYRIEAPFNDRIRLYYGICPIDIDMMATELIDLEGNVVCDKYNAIYFYFMEDGSYIGIGYNSSFNEVKCRDENGELYEEGCWLVDKDGNKVSTKYSTAETKRPVFMGDILSPEETFIIKNLDGEIIEIPIKEIAIKDS